MEMHQILAAQRAAFLAERPEALAVRRGRIERCIALIVDNARALVAATSADFGSRSIEQGLVTDAMQAVDLAQYCLKHLEKWAAPDKRHVDFPLSLLGAKAEVRYEPKGVVGIVSPWNYPLGLTFGPLVQAFAAGNRAMLKPSELTPSTSELIAELIAARFTADEVAVVLGDADVGKAFTALPFDHLIFTGSTAVGREVMKAAAENLVPVTLELGGKSPAIIGRSANLARMGKRIAAGKAMNGGQTCIAPDYLLVPDDREAETIAAVSDAVAAMYPRMADNPDYSSIVSPRHRARLESLVAEAVDQGAEALVVNPADEDFSSNSHDKLPFTILRGVTPAMKVMQEEIFGPVLPVATYRAIGEAIDMVNAAERPLALYYFGEDAGERELVLTRTISGGVTVNDVIFHNAATDLPFGGVGASGMGAYHGIEGFRELSHARAIYRQPRWDIGKLGGVVPPFGKATQITLKRIFGRKWQG